MTESLARRSETEAKNVFCADVVAFDAAADAASAAFFAVEEPAAAAAAAPVAAVAAPTFGPPGPGPEAPTIGGRMSRDGRGKDIDSIEEKSEMATQRQRAGESFFFPSLSLRWQ